VSKSLSDIITEFVWNAAHSNRNYGERELAIIKSMHSSVDLNTLRRIVLHARRTPKEASWDIVKQKYIN
jgi:hypothetical protein